MSRKKALAGLSSYKAEQFLSVIPKGRASKVDEVAAMAAHLASKEASFVINQVISVDGGSAML